MAKNNIAVFGVAPNRAVAELVVADLRGAQFPTNDISILLADAGATRDLALEKGTKAPEGAVAGGAAGGTLGGVVGVLAGAGTFAIPGIGPFLAVGPIMAALGGAAVGAAVGSLTGALVGFGLPEVRAKAYEGKVRAGAALISVHTESSAQREIAETIFKRHGIDDVATTTEASVPKAPSTTSPKTPHTGRVL